MDQDKVVAPDITSSTASTNRNEISCFKVTSAPMHILLSSSHRGSISTPILSTSNNLETKTRYTIATPTTTANITTITTADTTTTASAVVLPSLSRTTGTKRSTRDLISRTVGLNKSVGGNNKSMSQIDEVHHSSSPKASIASSVANEILSLIFRNLLDRKSILNCSLVSTHWHGPAKIELARIAQDMPFNGLGLVHAIRTRFAQDTFPFLSIAIFDKLVCNLSEIYYHSNPETKEVFAPAHAPDMLYHLFWTFLFIDQEFRNPRARSKVTCNYFVRLLQNEGGGYPREFLDKKALKNIYNDIRSRPLLPAPHLIRSLQGAEDPTTGNEDGNNNTSRTTSTTRYATRPAIYQRQSSLTNLASSIRLEEPFKRVRKWWKNVREESERNRVGWMSHLDSTRITSTSPSTTTITTPTTEGNNLQDTTDTAEFTLGNHQYQFETPLLPSNSPQVPPPPLILQGPSSTSGRSLLRPRFGAKSDLALSKSINKDNNNLDRGITHPHVRDPIMNQGFTTVTYGWHPEGDGLDNVVCFPKTKKPSTLGAQHQILQCSELLLEMETEI